MNQKNEAMKVLMEAVKQVNKAIDAIDNFAKEVEPVEREVDLVTLAEMVGKDLEMRPACAFAVLVTAFDMIKDYNLTVVFDGDEEDDDDNE